MSATADITTVPVSGSYTSTMSPGTISAILANPCDVHTRVSAVKHANPRRPPATACTMVAAIPATTSAAAVKVVLNVSLPTPCATGGTLSPDAFGPVPSATAVSASIVRCTVVIMRGIDASASMIDRMPDSTPPKSRPNPMIISVGIRDRPDINFATASNACVTTPEISNVHGSDGVTISMMRVLRSASLSSASVTMPVTVTVHGSAGSRRLVVRSLMSSIDAAASPVSAVTLMATSRPINVSSLLRTSSYPLSASLTRISMPFSPGRTISAMFHMILIVWSANFGNVSAATSHSTLMVATGFMTSCLIHPSNSTILSRASAKIFGHSPMRAPHAITQSRPALSALPSARM